MQSWVVDLQKQGIPIATQLPLSQYSTFRIGGLAKVAIFPRNRAELIRTLRAVGVAEERWLIVGKGSNVLFSDDGFDGTVIFTGGWQEISRVGRTMTVSAGVPLVSFANAACEASLQGAEFAHGIPGTLGGAVFMNAGAFEGCMSQICVSSEYLDMQSGEIRILCGEEQAFGTRTSFYATHPEAIILGATVELTEGNADQIRARMRDFMERRKRTQPLEYPSAGSVFKRPIGHFAGKLIEDCGLKGASVGGAQVSEKHAGFIVNRGGATAADVKALIRLIRSRVLERTGVELECEIRFI